MIGERVVCWFSCGITSAAACSLALKKYRGKIPVDICYCNTGSEHPDNRRFLIDMQEIYGQEIKILKNEKFVDTWDFWEKRRYIAGIAGAPCTMELKTKMRVEYQRPTDIHIFGFNKGEEARKERFEKNHPEVYIECPLIDESISKEDCFKLITVSPPEMYRLGYRNSNCIACPKGMAGYWNKIRVDFPEQFERMSKLERKLNASINKTYIKGVRTRVFLDELDPKAGRYQDLDISCGFDCELEASNG